MLMPSKQRNKTTNKTYQREFGQLFLTIVNQKLIQKGGDLPVRKPLLEQMLTTKISQSTYLSKDSSNLFFQSMYKSLTKTVAF